MPACYSNKVNSDLVLDSKESPCNEGDPGSIPGSGRSPGEGNGSPLQCSCLENPTDRGAWRGYRPWHHRESDTTCRLNQPPPVSIQLWMVSKEPSGIYLFVFVCPAKVKLTLIGVQRTFRKDRPLYLFFCLRPILVAAHRIFAGSRAQRLSILPCMGLIAPHHDSLGDKESACNAGDPGSIPGSGRSSGEGIGYPLQYSWASHSSILGFPWHLSW